MTTGKKALVVVAGIVRNPSNGRILLTQRLPEAHLGGLWEFPGGQVQPGESLTEALVRELEEEVGITVQIGRLLLDHIHAYPDRTVHLHFFECSLLGDDPEPRQAADLAWCLPGELGRYAMPEGNADVVELLG